jgi:hypothetical protein
LFPRGIVSGIFGFEVSIRQYTVLTTCLRIACRKYHKDTDQCNTIRDFMVSFKKGSSKFRSVLTSKLKPLPLPDGSGLRTFGKNLQLEFPSSVRMSSLVSKWNIGFMNTGVRVFSFKFYNNILGINSRVAHFNPEINAGRTFCVLNKILPPPKETIAHLFFDCPTTDILVKELGQRYLQDLNLEKVHFFLSNVSEYEKDNRPLDIILEIFRYVIWQYKLNGKVPSSNKFWVDFQYLVSTTIASSKNFELQVNDCIFFQRGHGHGRHP